MTTTSTTVIVDAQVFPEFTQSQAFDPGFIAIRGTEIAALGPMELAEPWVAEARQRIDAHGMVAIPGIVNVHTHLAAGVFRGILEDGPGQRGLYETAFPMEQYLDQEHVYWLGMLGCIEVLKAGCTTVNDIYYHADSLAEAVEVIGLRAVLAEKMFDVDLPRIGSGDYSRDARRAEQKLEANVDLIATRHGSANGRITCRMGTHATDTCSSGFLTEAAAEARRLGVGLHIHAAQSSNEMEHIRAQHASTPIEYLDRLGLLGEATLAVHCMHCTDHDLDLLRSTGTSYACCPTMYPRRGRFPRLMDFLARDIPTGFGTDWIRMDPWEGMRNALSAVRVLSGDAELLGAAELLKIQTAGSARALRLSDQVGSLAVGKKADIVLIDLRRPHLQPYYGDSVAGVLHTVYPHDVHTVVVDGEVVVRGGRVLRVDEEMVVAEVMRRVPVYRAWRRSVAHAPPPGAAN